MLAKAMHHKSVGGFLGLPFTVWNSSYTISTFIRVAVTERYASEPDDMNEVLKNEILGTVKKSHDNYDLFVNALYNLAPICFLVLCHPEDMKNELFNKVSFAILYFQLNWVLQSTVYNRHFDSLERKMEKSHVCYKTKRMIARFHFFFTISKTTNIFFVCFVMCILLAYPVQGDGVDATESHRRLIIATYVNNSLFSLISVLRLRGKDLAEYSHTPFRVEIVS